MKNVWKKIVLALKDRSIRNRIFFVVFALVVFRLLSVIPVPGVDRIALEQYLSSSQFFGVLNVFSGGGFSTLSIVMLGVSPYITASIIMQLLTIIFPKVKEMYQENGEIGRQKFNTISRWLTLPLALLQGFGFIKLFVSQGVMGPFTTFEYIVNVLIVAAGAMLVMWICELITEYGIGNGASMIIFAGIVAAFPTSVSQTLFAYDPSQLPVYIGFLVVGVLIIAGVVLVSEAERPVPVTYARQVRGVGSSTPTYLPIRMNQAGVMPIIFALSLLMFPRIIGSVLAASTNPTFITIGQNITKIFVDNQLVYGILNFVLVVFFTYFYTAVTFDPDQVATNLQKNGAFIPGVRPGVPTSEYLASVTVRITLFGSLFLGIIAVLPLIVQSISGITSIAIGGTALLIVVSVVTDLIKKINAQISMREY